VLEQLQLLLIEIQLSRFEAFQNSSTRNTGQSTLYYGLFVGAIELCIAAEAYAQIKPQLDFFKFLRLQISDHSLFFKP